MSQQESMHSLALIRLFELHISRLKQHTIALETNKLLQKNQHDSFHSFPHKCTLCGNIMI